MADTRLQARERETYEVMWAVEAYNKRSPGEEYADVFLQYAKPGQTVLDAGCGAGKGALALAKRGLLPVLADVTDAGLSQEVRDRFPFVQTVLWQDLRAIPYLAHAWYHAPSDVVKPERGTALASPDDGKTVDWCYCCDVMEHLPKQFTMVAVRHLLAIAKEGLFLSICFCPDGGFGAWTGQAVHQTVESFSWWKDNLNEMGRVQEARDLLGWGLFVVRPC
jgi:SAM-dependent methyltransferase